MGFFHGLVRVFHFLCAAGTAAIVDYLIFGLKIRHLFMHILSAAGHFTVISLFFVTFLFSFCTKSSPVGNIIRDFISLLLFSAGLGAFASYNVQHHLLSSCTNTDLNPKNACLLFKLLIVFNVLAIVAALAALVLDFILRRQQKWQYSNLEKNRGVEGGFGEQGSESYNMHLTPAQRYEQRRGEAAAMGPGPKPGIKRTLTLQLGKLHGRR